MLDLVAIKQRYGIIGHSPGLDHAINVAVQVAATDLSVLIMGESGVGKESFPKIIHDFSSFKHGPYITVNCGAIPEGTIDSELFGHEKGAFTGATDTRKGYFEVADGGTIFLDEVADLPLATQVRLLRVLETGDFIKVGSSKVQKAKVRVVAATNVNIGDRISKGKFREDLYYRLNTVPIQIPPLRERGDDVFMLFTKFAADFAYKYKFVQLELTQDAVLTLENYSWPGNIRQLKNVTEQMSLIEKERVVNEKTLKQYLQNSNAISALPVLVNNAEPENNPSNFERELIFKFLADMKREVSELKSMVNTLNKEQTELKEFQETIDVSNARIISDKPTTFTISTPEQETFKYQQGGHPLEEHFVEPIILEEQYSLANTERELIKKALDKHAHRRKLAAAELGISERTLYRKIKEYGL